MAFDETSQADGAGEIPFFFPPSLFIFFCPGLSRYRWTERYRRGPRRRVPDRVNFCPSNFHSFSPSFILPGWDCIQPVVSLLSPTSSLLGLSTSGSLLQVDHARAAETSGLPITVVADFSFPSNHRFLAILWLTFPWRTFVLFRQSVITVVMM